MKARINKYYFFILLAAALWGMAGIFVRNCENQGFEKMQIVLARAGWSVVLIGVLILIYNKRLFRVRLKDLCFFAGAGVLSILMFSFCYYKTMSLTSLSVAAVLLYTAPFFVIFLSAVLFRERLTVRKCVACLVAFAGCCLVSGVFRSETAIGPAAIGFGLLTGLGYGLYTVFSRILLDRGYHSLTIIFYTFLFACLGCLLFVNPVSFALTVTSSSAAFRDAFLIALLNSVFPYILYTKGLEGTESSVAPIIAMAEPVSATVVGALVYGEAITVSSAAGMILVLLGGGILNIKKGKERAEN